MAPTVCIDDRLDAPARNVENSRARWYHGLEKAIYTLERLPRRCPLAPEAKKIKRPVRHLLYGRKPNVYRVLYEIDETRKAVRVPCDGRIHC